MDKLDHVYDQIIVDIEKRKKSLAYIQDSIERGTLRSFIREVHKILGEGSELEVACDEDLHIHGNTTSANYELLMKYLKFTGFTDLRPDVWRVPEHWGRESNLPFRSLWMWVRVLP